MIKRVVVKIVYKIAMIISGVPGETKIPVVLNKVNDPDRMSAESKSGPENNFLM